MFARIRSMFRVPLDTEVWPESEGAGYSPNEMNGVLASLPESSWQVEPTPGSAEWDWRSI